MSNDDNVRWKIAEVDLGVILVNIRQFLHRFQKQWQENHEKVVLI